MQRLRQGDEVVVIAGSSKGARGAIERVIYDAARQQTHVVIDGVNKITKHSRGNPRRKDPDPGGRIVRSAPINISNIALFNSDKEKGDRVRIVVEGGKRKRVYATGGQPVIAPPWKRKDD